MSSFFSNKRCKVCKGPASTYRMEQEQAFFLCNKKSCHNRVNPETAFKNLEYPDKKEKK